MRGIIIGQDVDKLIVEATAKEIAAFSGGAHVVVNPMAPVNTGGDWNAQMQAAANIMSDMANLPGKTLHDVTGRMIGVVVGLTGNVHTPRIDVTAHGDSSPQFITGIPQCRLTIEVVR